jgi:hypothetical protein
MKKHSSIIGSENDSLTVDKTGHNVPDGGKSITKTYSKITFAALALALAGVAGSSLRGDDNNNNNNGRWKTLVIDVAEDARTAVLNQVSPTNALPKRGDTVIENGKIYPGGTIPAGNGFDIDTAGSIGTWVSRGTFNFDFSQALTGGDPIISSTDQYIFSSTGALNGQDSLMSEGQDSFLGTIQRAVVGGTGIYRGTIGEVKVEVLGANSTGFVNRRLTFQIRIPES